MEIIVYQSGGFAGEQVKLKALDTSTVSSTTRITLEKLIKISKFFQLDQQEVANRSMGSDMLRYQIDITDGENDRSLNFVRSDNTQSLNELLDFVLDCA